MTWHPKLKVPNLEWLLEKLEEWTAGGVVTILLREDYLEWTELARRELSECITIGMRGDERGREADAVYLKVIAKEKAAEGDEELRIELVAKAAWHEYVLTAVDDSEDPVAVVIEELEKITLAACRECVNRSADRLMSTVSDVIRARAAMFMFVHYFGGTPPDFEEEARVAAAVGRAAESMADVEAAMEHAPGVVKEAFYSEHEYKKADPDEARLGEEREADRASYEEAVRASEKEGTISPGLARTLVEGMSPEEAERSAKAMVSLIAALDDDAVARHTDKYSLEDHKPLRFRR